MIRRLFTDRSGSTAIEYGLIVALISISLIGSIQLYSGEMNNMFGYVSNIVSTPKAAD